MKTFVAGAGYVDTICLNHHAYVLVLQNDCMPAFERIGKFIISRLTTSFELTFTIKIHSSSYQDVWPETSTAGVMHAIIEFCVTTRYMNLYESLPDKNKRRGFAHTYRILQIQDVQSKKSKWCT